jgi:hypothetical protein
MEGRGLLPSPFPASLRQIRHTARETPLCVILTQKSLFSLTFGEIAKWGPACFVVCV